MVGRGRRGREESETRGHNGMILFFFQLLRGHSHLLTCRLIRPLFMLGRIAERERNPEKRVQGIGTGASSGEKKARVSPTSVKLGCAKLGWLWVAQRRLKRGARAARRKKKEERKRGLVSSGACRIGGGRGKTSVFHFAGTKKENEREGEEKETQLSERGGARHSQKRERA